MKKTTNKLLFAMLGIVVYLVTTADSCNCQDKGCQIQASWLLGTSKCNIPVWGSAFAWTDQMRQQNWRVHLKCTGSNNFCWEKDAGAGDVINYTNFLYNVPSSGYYTLSIQVTSPDGCSYNGIYKDDPLGCTYMQQDVETIF